MARRKTRKKVSKKVKAEAIEVKDSVVIEVKDSKAKVIDKKETKETKETKEKPPVIEVALDHEAIQRVYVKPKFNYLKAQGVK